MKTITIIVNDGAIEQVTGIPPGVRVEVRDYDTQDAVIDGGDDSHFDLVRDKDGDIYERFVFESEEK